MTTAAIMQKRSLLPLRPSKDDLPISQPPPNNTDLTCLRRRISSISVHLPSPAASWPFCRTKSSSFSPYSDEGGFSFCNLWRLGIGWLLSLKPSFARDLEMDDEEAAALGSHTRGTWRHLFYRLRCLVGSPREENIVRSKGTAAGLYY